MVLSAARIGNDEIRGATKASRVLIDMTKRGMKKEIPSLSPPGTAKLSDLLKVT